MARSERLTALLTAGLVLGTLLACKKKLEEVTGESSASVAAPAVSAPPAPSTAEPAKAASDEAPKLGDVTRYADKEKKSDEAAVKVLEDAVKVFNVADSSAPEVATLPKDLLVFRLAEVEGFELVEFPSGIGQFSQGWVETKALSSEPVKVAREAVLSEKKVADLKTDAGAPAPKPSATSKTTPSAKPSASAAPSAKPSATPSAKPTATATTKPTATPTAKPSAEPSAKPTSKSTKPVAPPPPPPPKTDDKKKK